MEAASQSLVIAAIYCMWAFGLYRMKLHRRAPFLFWYCVLSIAYNAGFYEWIWYQWYFNHVWATKPYGISLVMTAFRLAPGMEAAWILMRKEPMGKTYTAFIIGICVATIGPAAAEMKFAYLPVHNILLSAMTIGLLALVLIDWRGRLHASRIDRWSVRLLLCWYAMLAMHSLLYGFYKGFRLYIMAQWIYAYALVLIVFAVLTRRNQLQVALDAGHGRCDYIALLSPLAFEASGRKKEFQGSRDNSSN